MLCKLSVTKKNGVSNVQVKLTLAKVSSYRVWLILDSSRGHLGTSSAHLAAVWITGLASVLPGGDLALLPARTWFCPRSLLCTLALIPCGGKAGAALWDPFASSWLLRSLSGSCKKVEQVTLSESLNRAKMGSMCYTALPIAQLIRSPVQYC